MAEEKTILIVNPSGAIHAVSEDHARDRLRQGNGWRLATKAEQTAYGKTKTQRFDRPLAPPYAPDLPETPPETEG